MITSDNLALYCEFFQIYSKTSGMEILTPQDIPDLHLKKLLLVL